MTTEKQVVESREYYSNVGFWPALTKVDVEGWLSNFDDGQDRSIAVAILDSMIHLNEAQIVQGTISGFRALSTLPEFGSAAGRQQSWALFLESTYVSFPSGGSGDVTGSGHIFARILKCEGFDESRILDLDHLVKRIADNAVEADIVFLDDITGTGSQFKKSWRRKVDTSKGSLSLEDLLAKGLLGTVYYVPLAATSKAKMALNLAIPSLQLHPVYELDAGYIANHASTQLVPEAMRPMLPAFLQKYSTRSRVAKTGAYGFGKLGLALSFHHSTPNNTLPILQKKSVKTNPAWKPLSI